MKMRHVSVFRLKPEFRTPEIIEVLAQKLREMPGQLSTIVECEIGVKPFPMPTTSPDGLLKFYDIIQIITFADEAGCMAYPGAKVHQDFVVFSDDYMEEVIGIDYPV